MYKYELFNIFNVNVPESVSLLDWALRHERYTVVILGSSLPDSVPMDGDFHTFHVIFYIDYHFVVFAHLYARSGQHTIGGQNSSFDSISQHALTVTPYYIGSVWCAHLTSSDL